MNPVVVLVGRPNVGKSTLFNALTDTRDALVMDMPGVTRDRQYGDGKVGDKPYYVVDTGGIMADKDVMTQLADGQVQQALDEADRILFMVDAKEGLNSADELIAQRLRKQLKKVMLVVNKADRDNPDLVAADFYALGLGEPHIISAKSSRGVMNLMSHALEGLENNALEENPYEDHIPIAVIGRPNVGKSTLVNRMLGEERVIVMDKPGTTRDSIFIPYERRGEKYVLIDTAGVRRQQRIDATIEKFSVIKSLEAIRVARVVILVVDAKDGLADQDLRLLRHAMTAGRCIVLAFNKWDQLDDYEKEQFDSAVDKSLTFAEYARRYHISAKHGTGVGKLYRAIHESFEAAHHDVNTSDITAKMEQFLATHQPPLINGRRIKLRYAHLGGHFPWTVVIHGKQLDKLPGSYQRYLEKSFRKAYELVGVPIRLKFITDENPYATKERNIQ